MKADLSGIGEDAATRAKNNAELRERMKKMRVEIIQKLQKALGRPVEEVTDEEKLYKTLQDTFNCYDADGSCQMAFP